MNEIKAENELLQVYNNELKEEIEELRKQIVVTGADGDVGVNDQAPTLHSSMYREHEEVDNSSIISSKMEEDSIEGDDVIINNFEMQSSIEKGNCLV